jgi:hypothetical protein
MKSLAVSRQQRLEDNLKAVDVTLTADDLNALNEVSKLTPEYPEWLVRVGSPPGRTAVLTTLNAETAEHTEKKDARRFLRSLRVLRLTR